MLIDRSAFGNDIGLTVTGRALNRYNAWAAIRKRAKAAVFLTPVGCHTWRPTSITIYLENDGLLEHAQQMAGHANSRKKYVQRLFPTWLQEEIPVFLIGAVFELRLAI